MMPDARRIERSSPPTSTANTKSLPAAAPPASPQTKATSPSRGTWDMTPRERGLKIETDWGGNLPTNFPKIDSYDFDNDHAFSMKSIDLTLPSYANKPGAISSAINRYIREISGFRGATYSSVTIDGNKIKARILMVAITPGATADEMNAIKTSVKYGANRSVPVQVSIHTINY